MKINMILPALTEAKSPYWRPIKYSLFPPLGLATLAAYCSAEDELDPLRRTKARGTTGLTSLFIPGRIFTGQVYKHDNLKHAIKHFSYAGGWKKFEPLKINHRTGCFVNLNPTFIIINS